MNAAPVCPQGRLAVAAPRRGTLPLFVAAMEKDGWRPTLHPADGIYVCRSDR